VKTAFTFTAATALALLALSPGCGSPDRPATWSYISPVIFEPNCASGSCHSPAAAAAGLDFSTPDRGYTSLTGRWVWIVDPSMANVAGCGHAAGTIVCERQYRPLVTPYDPSGSRLINVLRGRDAPRMPPDRPLDEADIRLVEDWILNGARKDDRAPVDGATADGGFRSDAGAGAQADASDADAVEAPPADSTPDGDAASEVAPSDTGDAGLEVAGN
jgi:hypothetical protein